MFSVSKFLCFRVLRVKLTNCRFCSYRDYYIPRITKRYRSDLWKPIAFAGGFSLFCFAGASIVHYEGNKNDRPNDSSNLFHQKQRRISGDNAAAALVGLNGLVFIAWRLLPRSFMFRNFTSWYYGEKLYSRMILSAFSHRGFFHFVINMCFLSLLGSIAVDEMGIEQFLALYLSSAAVSSAVRFIPKVLRKQRLGASGVIFTFLTYCICKYESGSQITVVETDDFKRVYKYEYSGGPPVAVGIIVFHFLALVFRFKRFDHAGHLGGSLFGMWYCFYGEKLLWEQMRPKWVKVWKAITGR